MAVTTCSQTKSSLVILPKRKKVSILVLGKTGSGKSSIINAMLKGEVARTSSSPTPTEHNFVEPHMHEESLGGVTSTLIMYDTRGFFDQEISEDDILSGISQECIEGFSLILICLKVDRSMCECLQKLGRRFDKDLWKRCIFVLTFTNYWLEYNDICDLSKDQKIAALIKQIKAFKKTVKEYTKEIISEDIFDEIPFVLAGTIKELKLIPNDDTEVIASDDAERNILAATENWLKELWRVCVRQCEDTKKPLLDNFSNKVILNLLVGAVILGATIMLKK